MKNINLLSLVQAHNSLGASRFKSFSDHYDIKIGSNEIVDLNILTNEISKVLTFINIFNNFYVGYKIQNISKEFDLLRFGTNYIINVEIKNESSEDKILKQLIRNRYYLGHINKVIHNFCFVSKTKTLYLLNSLDQIEVISQNYLVQLLTNQNLMDLENPDSLFNPSDYLVSPFNSTAKFLRSQYFLTGQQETIKEKVLENIGSGSPVFISLTGGPGTGKTLLTYDIVKSVRKKLRTLIIHCGQLNDGHLMLKGSGWNIIPIRDFSTIDFTAIDLIVVDETQRIYSWQFDKLIADSISKNICCIFSHDKQQTLSSTESKMDIDNKINAIANIFKYKLSDKIRTNGSGPVSRKLLAEVGGTELVLFTEFGLRQAGLFEIAE